MQVENCCFQMTERNVLHSLEREKTGGFKIAKQSRKLDQNCFTVYDRVTFDQDIFIIVFDFPSMKVMFADKGAGARGTSGVNKDGTHNSFESGSGLFHGENGGGREFQIGSGDDVGKL